MPIEKQPDAFRDVCPRFVLPEMTDAIEFKDARVRQLARPAYV